ncbi:hypothetical protein Taro_011753 [Colocasia esculenta]|uniref:Uncharacterized protein n=1 Tax=Colocasia esculenta TaxID=4460 RepID=A0A843UBK1_COLES|nr:hypothetical protein [Colocasia esculenta]
MSKGEKKEREQEMIVQTLFAKEVSTHPTMVSTQQPRFKGKKVDTASEQVDTGPCSQNSCSQIWDSVSTPPPGQVDTLRKDCNLNWMFATCQPRAMVYQPRIVCPWT